MIKPTVLAVAVLTLSLIAGASELGAQRRSRASSRAGVVPSEAANRPSLTDDTQDSRIRAAGTLRQNNTGIDSMVVAARAAADAAKFCSKNDWQKHPKVCTSAYFATKAQGQQINITGCKILQAHVNASCYGGVKDRFFNGRPTTSGMTYNNKLVTAAYPDTSRFGELLVVSYRGQNRYVAPTDKGPSSKMQRRPYNRGIDLSPAAFDSLGGRCEFDGVYKDVTIYSCPARGNSASTVAKK